MDIRKKIGIRISQSRKALGLTIKELAEKTGTLSAARISNWENGTRSPGPTEAMMLAKPLQVAASYLLCLSDDERGEITTQESLLPRVAPIIPLTEAHQYAKASKKSGTTIPALSNDQEKISLECKSKNTASKNTFAVSISDNSMHPKFSSGDILIADPDLTPQPGDFVLAHIPTSNVNVIRKYRETEQHSVKNKSFELIALNADWGVIRVSNANEAAILATAIEHRAYLK